MKPPREWSDASVPAGVAPASLPSHEPSDPRRRAAWTPDRLAAVVARLASAGPAALAGIGDGALLAAWEATVATWRDPDSPGRRALDPLLVEGTGLSPAGLRAALETVLAGVSGPSAAALVARAAPSPDRRPALVVLAANLPALGLQALLPALALRRPVLLKSPSAEPFFLPAFVAELSARLPALADGVAAAGWRGGDEALERPVLAAVGRVLAYGDEPALADLERRAPGKVVGQGPKVSVGLVGGGVDPAGVAMGLARDVALFDQRGCLSPHAVYTAGDAAALAAELACALARVALDWPPGVAPLALVAGVRQAVEAAAVRGLAVHCGALGDGTVIVDPDPDLRASPGLRTVRVHPVADLALALAALARWRGRLQGAALAGAEAERLGAAMRDLGCSRLAPPGELQAPDFGWANGGIDPLAALA